MRHSAGTSNRGSDARWVRPASTSSSSARRTPNPQAEQRVSTRRYRVVQWATGNIGTRALREVIRHPGLELAGVVVYDPAKDGVDAGELCGEPATGVCATTDRASVTELRPDCVLYMARALDLDEVVELLESG